MAASACTLTPDSRWGWSYGELTADPSPTAHGPDHLGLTASSRRELEEWERRFDEYGVVYTPIRDMEMGHHLNFRDPDGIALELCAANQLALTARAALASGHTTSADIAAFVAEHVGPEYVPRAYASTKVRPAPVKRPSALPSA